MGRSVHGHHLKNDRAEEEACLCTHYPHLTAEVLKGCKTESALQQPYTGVGLSPKAHMPRRQDPKS